MANLMITNRCNLHCPYCFANEFVNKQDDEMSFEDFKRCLDFMSSNYKERIGIIGGEPTLHPEFKQMLGYLIDTPFESVCIFTNGILIDHYINELRNSKFQILVNLNSPVQIGEERYNRIVSNIDAMLNQYYMRGQIGVGINLYSPDMEYDYILEILKRFHLNKVRVSVSIPNMAEGQKVDPLQYFHTMEDLVRRFVKDMVAINVAPVFDCNYLMKCLFEEKDLVFFEKNKEVFLRSNIFENAICSPTLDILPDLRVVRCFGTSDLYKVNLFDFRNTEEIKRHFLYEIDALAYHILPNEECNHCKEYQAGLCSCGCYAYRLEKLRIMRNRIHTLTF